MKFLKGKTHVTDLIFTLSLFGVFAVSALLVVVIGADVYRSAVIQMDRTESTRTPLTYVAEKVRQNDREDGISLGEIDGIPALVLHDRYGDEQYNTYIYAYDGSLRELFQKSSADPQKEAGQIISEISDFTVDQVSDKLYLITSADGAGNEMSLYISPKCN